jgi:anti-sigma factor RsiW
MSTNCPTSFDQTMLSGYIDDELTQGEEQRVRLHLEDCESCRQMHLELTTIRETAMSTRFENPRDEQWDESPRGNISLFTRGLGWTMAVIWIASVAAFGLWHAATGPESLVEKLLIFGGITAAALLFVSVLIDRIRVSRTDRYREVKK